MEIWVIRGRGISLASGRGRRNISYCRVGRHPFQLRNWQKRHLGPDQVQPTDNSAPGVADLGTMCCVPPEPFAE